MTPRDPKDITNHVLLGHMQSMKEKLGNRIGKVETGVNSLGKKVGNLEKRIDNLSTEMKQGFQEAKQHREALQEDLEATILKLDHVHKNHERRIVRLEEHTGLVGAA